MKYCHSPTTTTTPTTKLSNRWKPPPPTTTQTQNYMIEQKYSKTQKTKDISLFEETPKQFLNPTSSPKIAHWGPKKSKYPKIKSYSKVRIEGIIKSKSQNQKS